MLGQSYYHLRAIANFSVEDYTRFHDWFHVFNLFLLLCVGGSIMSFVHSYATAKSAEERRRVEMKDFRGIRLNPTLALKNEHIAWFTHAKIFAVHDALDFQRPDIDLSREDLLRRLGCGVCVPLISESEDLLGVLAARTRASRQRLSEEEIDLRRLCKHVLRTMRYQLVQHKFSVELTSGKGEFVIRGDPDSLELALSNLVLNAIKYSGEKKYLKISLARKGSWILCSVQDRGLGISEDAQLHLFEKFYRDASHSSKIQGVGLGLPLVKHVIDAHGGKIEVKSRVKRGSTFTIWFHRKSSDGSSHAGAFQSDLGRRRCKGVKWQNASRYPLQFK